MRCEPRVSRVLSPLRQGLIEFIIEDTGLTGRAQDTCQKSSPVPFVVSPGGQVTLPTPLNHSIYNSAVTAGTLLLRNIVACLASAAPERRCCCSALRANPCLPDPPLPL